MMILLALALMHNSWIEVYGPWAVFIGGIFEGETVFMAAGYAISQGYMEPVSTLLLATAGGTLGDLTFYVLGRRYGTRLIQTTTFLRRLQARATLLLRRWGHATAFLMRFAYGLRTVLPASVGAARLPWTIFLPFNLLGSVTFASVYLLLGYFFGEALERLLERTTGYEGWVLLGIGVFGVLIWVIREWSLLRKTQDIEQEDTG